MTFGLRMNEFTGVASSELSPWNTTVVFIPPALGDTARENLSAKAVDVSDRCMSTGLLGGLAATGIPMPLPFASGVALAVGAEMQIWSEVGEEDSEGLTSSPIFKICFDLISYCFRSFVRLS